MPADLTLILGPQTRGAMALNDYIRETGGALSGEGVRVLPKRFAAPLIRQALDQSTPLQDRLAAFEDAVAPGPTVLSALTVLGRPEAALKNGTLFEGMDAVFEGLQPFAGTARFVLTVDRLPAFYLAQGSDRLEARVKATPWDVLYELGWARLAEALSQALPKAELLVVTPEGLARRPAAAMARIFGVTVGDPIRFLRAAMTETGRAVLDRMLASGVPEQATLDELSASFADTPSLSDIHDRLGIEKITAELLEQRYREDLATIAALPRAEVI